MTETTPADELFEVTAAVTAEADALVSKIGQAINEAEGLPLMLALAAVVASCIHAGHADDPASATAIINDAFPSMVAASFDALNEGKGA